MPCRDGLNADFIPHEVDAAYVAGRRHAWHSFQPRVGTFFCAHADIPCANIRHGNSVVPAVTSFTKHPHRRLATAPIKRINTLHNMTVKC